MKKKMRSLTFLFAGVIALQTVIAGCGNTEDKAGDAKPAEKKENVTLRLFSSHGQFKEGSFGQKEVNEFMKANPHIKVEVTTANGKQWLDTFQALAASRDLPDVFQPTNSVTLADMLSNKWIQPLDDLVGDDFKKRFPEGTFLQGVNMDNGKVYSFPRIVAKKGRVLAYNKDILQKAGLDPDKPPKTWDELYQMSKQVKEKTGLAGLVLPLKETVGYGDILSLGQPYYPTIDQVIPGFDLKEGRYAFDNPNIVKTFDFVNKLNKDGLLHPNSFTLSLTDGQGVFANKQAAFTINQHWIVRTLELELNQTKDFGITEIPVPEAGMVYTQPGSSADFNAYISATTKHPKEAGQLIEWMTTKDYYTRQMKEDLLLAPMPDLYKDAANFPKPELKALADTFSKTVVEKPVAEKKPEVTEVRKLEAAQPKPKPDWWEIMQAAYFGKGNITEDLKKYNDAMNDRLDKAVKQAQDKGLKVTKEDFVFKSFDGKKDFKN